MSDAWEKSFREFTRKASDYTKNEKRNPIAIDLRDHFHDRLQTILMDSVETCQHADLDRREIVAMHFAVMLNEASLTAVHLHLSEKNFLLLCAASYRRGVISKERGEGDEEE